MADDRYGAQERQRRLGGIENEIGRMYAEIGELRRQNGALREEIGDLRTEVRGLRDMLNRGRGGFAVIIGVGILVGWLLTQADRIRAWLG